MYMCVCVFTRVSQPLYGGSEGNLRESFLSSCRGGPGIELRLLSLGRKVHLLLSHLALCLHRTGQKAEAQKSVWWNRPKSAEVTWPHSSFYLFIFLFICVWYVDMYSVCMWVGMHAQVCVWRTEMDVRCPWLTLAFFAEQGSHWPWCLLICTV